MKKLQFWTAILLVTTPCCVPPTGQPTGRPLEKRLVGRDLFSIKGMTEATVEIEAALGTERLGELQAHYQKAFRADPRNPFKRYLWAYSLENRNEAWEELIKITKLNDRFYWSYLGMGVILDGWKVYDQAEKNYKKAIELGSNIAIGYGRLGEMYLKKGNTENALLFLKTAVAKSSNEIIHRLNLARALDKAGQIQEAMKTYREAIKLEPSLFTSHAELADLLRRSGGKAEAIGVYKQAAALDQKAYEVRFALAELFAELQRDEEALTWLQEACNLKPKTLSCWQVLAKLAAKMGKKELQVAAFEQVVRIDKENLEAHKSLAPMYLEAGEIEKALPSYQVIQEKEKDNLDALLGLSNIYEKGEEFSNALEFNERILTLRPDQPEARAALERLYQRFHVLPEGITGKNPDQVFAKNRQQIAKVYKQRLGERPGLKGDLLVKVTVSNDGIVTNVSMARNTVGDQVIDICTLWNLRRSKFPKGFGATYDFELILKPGD